METTEIITPKDELIKMVKDGLFFNFCVAFALNKGYRDAVKNKEKVEFSVGDYDVKFDGDDMCFILSHKVYFAKVIMTYFQYTHYVGTNEAQVIDELLTEVEKELSA